MIKRKQEHPDCHIIRFEQRYMNKRKISKATGFETATDILNNYKQLPELYNAGWQGEVFKYTGKDVMIMYARKIEAEILYFMLDENGNIRRNWQQKHLQMKGLQYIIENEGKDVYKIALQNVLSDMYSRKNTITVKVKRAMDKLDEVKTDLEMIKNSKVPDKTILTLYNELKYKLLQAA